MFLVTYYNFEINDLFQLFQSECLKHILYNLRSESDRNVLHDPVLALGRDASKVEGAKSEAELTAQNVGHRLRVLQTLVEAQKSALKKLTNCLREAEAQKSTLIKELDDERRKHEDDTAQGDDITYCLEKDRSKLRQVWLLIQHNNLPTQYS